MAELEERIAVLEKQLADITDHLVKHGDQVWLQVRGGSYIGVDNGANMMPVNTGDAGARHGRDEGFTIHKAGLPKN